MNKAKKISLITAIIFAFLILGCIFWNIEKQTHESDSNATSNIYAPSHSTSANKTFLTNGSYGKRTQATAKTNQNIIKTQTQEHGEKHPTHPQSAQIQLSQIKEYSGKPYIVLNQNNPNFTTADIEISPGTIEFSSLDYLNRCGKINSCLGIETMPTDERGDISSIHPSGWKQKYYDFIDGRALYNRCHLIGWQLCGENANKLNLITGTRYLNTQGMLPFENMVADYIKETHNHVFYRVTPLFEKTELVCRGVVMEAYSIEDDGDGICFNVFCYNVQPGVVIDYKNGNSHLDNTIKITTKSRSTKKTKKIA